MREIEEFASQWFKIVTTRAVERALSLAQGDASIAAIIANQSLTGSSGLTILKAVQQSRPAIHRVLLADPAALSDIIDGLHCGAVNRVIYKPIRTHELAGALAPARAIHEAKRATA